MRPFSPEEEVDCIIDIFDDLFLQGGLPARRVVAPSPEPQGDEHAGHRVHPHRYQGSKRPDALA